MSDSRIESAAQPTQKYPVRQFVLYQAAMSGRAVTSPEDTVRDYARSHPGVDLEEQLTFAEWLSRDTEGAPA